MRLKKMTKQSFATAVLSAALMVVAVPAAANETVALKNALYGAGYEVGNVNSTMGESARSALRSFQQDQGLEVTGELDEPTKAALGMVPMDQVATAPEASPSEPAAGAAQDPATETEPASEQESEENAVEEDDDGGWSFF